MPGAVGGAGAVGSALWNVSPHADEFRRAVCLMHRQHYSKREQQKQASMDQALKDSHVSRITCSSGVRSYRTWCGKMIEGSKCDHQLSQGDQSKLVLRARVSQERVRDHKQSSQERVRDNTHTAKQSQERDRDHNTPTHSPCP